MAKRNGVAALTGLVLVIEYLLIDTGVPDEAGDGADENPEIKNSAENSNSLVNFIWDKGLGT
jgi:hypothetical protein